MPASYRVELSPAAQRQARRLTPVDARRIRRTLRGLAADPGRPGRVKLSGFDSVWRVRTGAFRIIFEVHPDERRLMVLRIARRDERTYSGL